MCLQWKDINVLWKFLILGLVVLSPFVVVVYFFFPLSDSIKSIKFSENSKIIMESVVFAAHDEVGDGKQRRLPLALIIYFQNVIVVIITVFAFFVLVFAFVFVWRFKNVIVVITIHHSHRPRSLHIGKQILVIFLKDGTKAGPQEERQIDIVSVSLASSIYGEKMMSP